MEVSRLLLIEVTLNAGLVVDYHLPLYKIELFTSDFELSHYFIIFFRNFQRVFM